jgi:hypothetical protein
LELFISAGIKWELLCQSQTRRCIRSHTLIRPARRRERFSELVQCWLVFVREAARG